MLFRSIPFIYWKEKGQPNKGMGRAARKKDTGDGKMVISLFHRHRQGLAVLMLAAAVLVTMAVKRADISSAGKSSPVSSTAESAPLASSASGAAASGKTAAAAATGGQEMRAVWVPYYTLDMSGQQQKGKDVFLKHYTEIVQNAKARGMNALVVHVRAFSDAMYPSKLYPWSHLTGCTQGTAPGYDPLKEMVRITHGAGLQFHAWINPLRVQLGAAPSILAEGNPWNRFSKDSAKAGWAASCKSGKYLDPGWEGVRQYIADGAAEVAANYDVDGIQFDDYFYPEDSDDSFDAASYRAYCAGKKAGEVLSRQDWRCANINDLISRTYRAIKKSRPQAVFGVSPQGNLENDRKIGADAAAWCQAEGYVDYVCPQVYYNYNNPILPYEKAVHSWRSLVTAKGVKLYFGLGMYKADTSADSGSWSGSTDIIARQIKTARAQHCDGFMLFAYDDMMAPGRQQEVQNVMKMFS